jgi:hypothetical protein
MFIPLSHQTSCMEHTLRCIPAFHSFIVFIIADAAMETNLKMYCTRNGN